MTPRVQAWLAILVTAIGLYLVGRWQGAANAADVAATENAQAILRLKAPYLKRISELTAKERHALTVATTWRSQADSLRSLALRVDTIALPDSAPASRWRAAANACNEEVTAERLGVATCQERAAVAEQRVAALDSSLAGLLKVKDCYVLWLHCPSRTTVGLLGLGIGFTAGLVIRP